MISFVKSWCEGIIVAVIIIQFNGNTICANLGIITYCTKYIYDDEEKDKKEKIKHGKKQKGRRDLLFLW